MSEKVYGILYKDGKYEKLTGNNIQEAFSKNGRKTKDGNIDFSMMETYEILPSSVLMDLAFGNEEYMLFLMRDKKSDWNPVDKIFSSFANCEEMMKLKVKMEGFFSGIVVDMKTEKPVSWIWSK